MNCWWQSIYNACTMSDRMKRPKTECPEDSVSRLIRVRNNFIIKATKECSLVSEKSLGTLLGFVGSQVKIHQNKWLLNNKHLSVDVKSSRKNSTFWALWKPYRNLKLLLKLWSRIIKLTSMLWSYNITKISLFSLKKKTKRNPMDLMKTKTKFLSLTTKIQ